MMIYHLDCSVNMLENSLTRKYSKLIVERITEKRPDIGVHYVDLMKENIPFINKEYKDAMFKPEEDRTNQDIETLNSFDINAFVEADIYVLGVPGYFFNVPAIFKNWFEHLFRFDLTLTKNWVGLLQNKKMYVVSAWGGIYANTEIEHAFEHIIRKSFGLFGINDIKLFNIYNDVETETNNIKNIERAIVEII